MLNQFIFVLIWLSTLIIFKANSEQIITPNAGCHDSEFTFLGSQIRNYFILFFSHLPLKRRIRNIVPRRVSSMAMAIQTPRSP